MSFKFFLFSMLLPLAAQAGAISGGGGKSVVCRDQNNKIISAELLDLYEGRNLYGLKIKNFGSSIDENIKGIEDKLLTTMDQPDFHLFPLITLAQKIMHLVPEGTKLIPIDDAAELATPVGCKIEQLANYVDDTLLLVDSEIWNALDVTNKSALILHEAIYRLERYDGATDSRRARKVVAHLFSDFVFENVRAGLPQDARQCTAMAGPNDVTVFYAYPTPNGMTKLQFIWIRTKAVFSKNTAVIPLAWPWKANHAGNISGGSNTSNFEGNQFVVIGADQAGTYGIDSKFYIDDDNKKYFISCE